MTTEALQDVHLKRMLEKEQWLIDELKEFGRASKFASYMIDCELVYYKDCDLHSKQQLKELEYVPTGEMLNVRKPGQTFSEQRISKEDLEAKTQIQREDILNATMVLNRMKEMINETN